MREAKGVASLLALEADAVNKSGSSAAPDAILKPEITYATNAQPAALDKSFPILSDDFVWTYTKNPTASWPPAWLPKGSGSLAENAPIKAGLDRLFTDAGQSLQGAETSLASIKGVRDDLREYRAREARLNDLAKTDDRRDLDTRMHARVEDLKQITGTLQGKLKAAHDKGLLKENSLSKEYNEIVSQSKVQSEEAFKIVRDAAANAGAKPEAKLFRQGGRYPTR